MLFLLTSVAFLFLSALIIRFISPRSPVASVVSQGGLLLFSLVSLGVSLNTLLAGGYSPVSIPWGALQGSLIFELDSLSAFFMLPVSILTFMTTLYTSAYLKPMDDCRRWRSIWSHFNLLIASLALVLIAKNGTLFLLSWELMSLSSFFLVLFENEKRLIQRAGWLYFSLTHIGTGCLFVLFFILSRESLLLDFSLFQTPHSQNMLWVCFILSLIGFGTKAGIMPLHIWMPEAYPAAPSPITALMSGAMSKMGVYGFLRFMFMLGTPPPQWGYLLVAVGAVSAVLAILFAIAQKDIKRMLAYSSVENMGIIFIGLGLGFYGQAIQASELMVLGFGGALLHVLNHSLFKGMLFLSAGSVIHQTHTHELDKMGGLIKKMPKTALAFLMGSLAICGLPLFNGFVSEFFLYYGSFSYLLKATFLSVSSYFLPLLAILALTTAGGLAALCFAKAYSVMFLGEPRYGYKNIIQESPSLMVYPMLVLGGICLYFGVFPLITMPLLEKPLSLLAGTLEAEMFLRNFSDVLIKVAVSTLIFSIFLIAVVWYRRVFLKGRVVEYGPTWDCGYVKPSVRMQYTASSFSFSLVDLFRSALQQKKNFSPIKEYFPTQSHLRTETDDVTSTFFYSPLYKFIQRKLYWFIQFQHGRIHLYVLYIVAALVLVVFSAMGFI